MTCQDCELRLAQAEMDVAVEEHMRECVACRTLCQDLAANASALEALRSDELPWIGVKRIAVKTPRRGNVYPWVAAAAAALFALALLVPHTAPPKPVALPVDSHAATEPSQPTHSPEAAKVEPVKLRPQKFEALKIKMLTSDPDVVIYWLIED
jgi:hypothetical protein